MGTRLLVAGVTLAALLSAVVLGAMLATPFLPSTAGAPSPTPSSTPTPEPTPEEQPPVGLFLLRGPYAFGACLGLDLTPDSFPGPEAVEVGHATVVWWDRGITGCDSRSGDLTPAGATVVRVARASAPDELAGYALDFSLPVAGAGSPTVQVELTILVAQSTAELLQVVDSGGGGGQGMVFDRVPTIDPPINPIPSQTAAAFEPQGIFLLAGPLAPDGPCLVIELGQASYPPAFGATGTAMIRWWERAGAQQGHPEDCLGRTGEVSEAETSVNARGPQGMPDAYFIGLPPAVVAALGEETSLRIEVPGSTPEHLVGFVGTASGETAVTFDRVDSIDPPLVSP